MTKAVFAILESLRIVPVIEIADVSAALPLADALAEGGLPVMEITLRTAAAVDAIRLIAAERPHFLVGAGTVLVPDDVDRAIAAGAEFLVSPGLTTQLAASVKAASVPFIPGVATASEAMTALDAGHRLVKFFPAEALGGVRALAALAAPLRGRGIGFMPTGGIRLESLRDYLAVPEVVAVGGTWIATVDALASRDFSGIAERANQALQHSVR